MAKAELVIHLVTGTPRLNIWCDTCLTSARFEVDYYRLTSTGPRQMGTVRRCHHCDRGA